MGRSSCITRFFTVHLVMLAMFMAAPAPVMSQTITITTIEQLQKIGDNASYPLDGDYVLGGDIDASATRSWNAGAGFEPIGTRAIPFSAFSGSFDGHGYAIRGLYINRTAAKDVGLFGYVSGEPATIKNVAIENAEIKGKSFTGALVGYNNNCLIYNCCSTGSVSAETDYAGGLVGWSQASTPITNCYSTSAVTGQLCVGGLLGYNSYTPVIKSYSAGAVRGVGSLVGGLIGYSTIATASDCFWDNSTSGQPTSAGGILKSTADMKKRSTFVNAGWDFATVWGIFDNQNYPFFRGANDLPKAEPDFYSASRNNVLSTQAPGVLANDFDADGDPLTAVLATSPLHGSLSFNADGSFTYTPEEDFSGTDSFTYKARAGADYTAETGVTLVVGNTAPIAVTDNYTVNRNRRLSVRLQGVLDNDSDPNGDSLTAVLAAGPAHGTLDLKENGSFTYEPEKDFFGTDNFTYCANDGELNSAPAVVTINVKALCPLVYLFGEDSPEVETLRRYRDEVLEASAAGRAGIQLFYRMAPVVEGFLENSPRMQRMARTIIDGALPGIRERLLQQP